VFLPPDDEGLIYFVGPNLIEVERRYSLVPSDFRLWVAIHEVTHRVQFSAAPGFRGYKGGRVDEKLATVSLDPHQLMDQLRRAAEEARTGSGPGGILRLLTPEQRAIFERTQAMMSLLEGHASFVMNEVGKEHIATLSRLRNALQARRHVRGVEQRFQRAIGFDQKVAQYDTGERFVRDVIERVGMSGFNLVWESREHLPQPGEVADPDSWIARVTRYADGGAETARRREGSRTGQEDRTRVRHVRVRRPCARLGERRPRFGVSPRVLDPVAPTLPAPAGGLPHGSSAAP